jgi:hypothetical protein
MDLVKEQRNSFADWMMPASAVLTALALLKEVFDASRWPFVHDAPLLHYIVFLMSKGFVPYRDIIDMNMPGTYLLESLGMHVFGGGARGWFLWDLVGVGMIILGSAWVAGPRCRAAGMIAGCVTSLFHLADGALNLGQRDWIIAGLLIAAFGCMFHMLRGGRAAWLGGAALLIAVAASVKPPAILFDLIMLGALGSRECREPKRALIWAVGGTSVPIVVIGLFLAKWHAIGSFVTTIRGLIPYYASLQRIALPVLIWSGVGRFQQIFLSVAAGALALFLIRRGWRSFASTALLLGSLAGAVTYIWQDKGWAYQRYPVIAFTALLIAMEIEKGIRSRGSSKWVAASMLAAMVLILPCGALLRERHSTYPTGTMIHLESDLTRIGGAQLSNHVQCLDMTHGECVNVLYREHLVESTGTIYDFYLFPQRSTPLTDELQSRFLRQVSANPPWVFVLSDQDWPGGGRDYEQLARWPAFSNFLAEHYQLQTQFNAGPGDMAGYRIYVVDDQHLAAR